jgi:hypothetical protein
MKKNNSLTPALVVIVIVAVTMVVWSITYAFPVEAAGDAIVVIVNNANPVNNLSVGELKKLFLGDRSHWETGKAVTPVMLTPGAPERTAFLKIVCGMSDADLSKYFLQAAFTGKSATPPKEVGSAAAVKSFVASSPVGDTTVKAVKVDTAASDPGYKIKM